MLYVQGLRALMMAMGMYFNDENIRLKVGIFDEETKELPQNKDLKFSTECQDLSLFCMRIYFDVNIPEAEKGKYIMMNIASTIHDVRKAGGENSRLIPTLIDIINHYFADEANQVMASQKVEMFGGKAFVDAHTDELKRLHELTLKVKRGYGEYELQRLHDFENISRCKTQFEEWIGVPFVNRNSVNFLNAPILDNKKPNQNFSIDAINADDHLLPIDLLCEQLSKGYLNDDQDARHFLDSCLARVVAIQFKSEVIDKMKLTFRPELTQAQRDRKIKTNQFIAEFKKNIEGLCENKFIEQTEEFRKSEWFSRSIMDGRERKLIFDIRRVILFYWYKGLLPNINAILDDMNSKISEDVNDDYSPHRFEQFKKLLEDEIKKSNAKFGHSLLTRFTDNILSIFTAHCMQLSNDDIKSMVRAFHVPQSKLFAKFETTLTHPPRTELPAEQQTALRANATEVVATLKDRNPRIHPTPMCPTIAADQTLALLHAIPVIAPVQPLHAIQLVPRTLAGQSGRTNGVAAPQPVAHPQLNGVVTNVRHTNVSSAALAITTNGFYSPPSLRSNNEPKTTPYVTASSTTSSSTSTSSSSSSRDSWKMEPVLQSNANGNGHGHGHDADEDLDDKPPKVEQTLIETSARATTTTSSIRTASAPIPIPVAPNAVRAMASLFTEEELDDAPPSDTHGASNK